MGGALYEAVEYRGTTDFMTLVCLGWCLIFFVFNVGCNIYAQERKIHQDMVMLSELQHDMEASSKSKPMGISGLADKDEDE